MSTFYSIYYCLQLASCSYFAIKCQIGYHKKATNHIFLGKIDTFGMTHKTHDRYIRNFSLHCVYPSSPLSPFVSLEQIDLPHTTSPPCKGIFRAVLNKIPSLRFRIVCIHTGFPLENHLSPFPYLNWSIISCFSN